MIPVIIALGVAAFGTAFLEKKVEDVRGPQLVAPVTNTPNYPSSIFTTSTPADRPVVTTSQKGVVDRVWAGIFGGSTATQTTGGPGFGSLIQMALVLGFCVVGYAVFKEVLGLVRD